jgi:hypothetical protein
LQEESKVDTSNYFTQAFLIVAELFNYAACSTMQVLRNGEEHEMTIMQDELDRMYQGITTAAVSVTVTVTVSPDRCAAP